MTYARARLWLSISGILTIVILAVLLLLFNVPMLLPMQPQPFATELQMLTGVMGLYLLVSLPFDLFGGYILPMEYSISEQSLVDFLIVWLRGAAVQTVAYVAIATLLIQIGRSLGFTFFALTTAVLLILLVLIQKPLASLLGGLSTKEVDLTPYAEKLKSWGIPMVDVSVLGGKQTAFMGGFAGIPGGDEIILPHSWFEKLSTEEISILLARRIELLESGGRGRGVWVAIAWNFIGLVGSSMLFSEVANIGSVGGIVTLSLAFTIWSFLGMLVLPRFSRKAVHAADRNLGYIGLRKTQLRKTFTSTERLQDREAVSVNAMLAAVYDVPLVEVRLDAMEESGPVNDRSAWNVSRMALYLSWVGLGLLSRMSPHAIGRPELWVLAAGD